MYPEPTVTTVWSFVGAVAVACVLVGGAASAKDSDVTIVVHVDSHGLDLNRPADAQKAYASVKHAARIVCTHGNRIDLQPSADPQGCYERALGDAIRSVNARLLTLIYLETHTLREAAARGIEVPAQVAAK